MSNTSGLMVIPNLSIIVSVYNPESNLRRFVDSILVQSFTVFIMLVD